MCQVTVLIDGSVFAQAGGSCTADSGGSVSITLCVVGAPDSAGVPPDPPASGCPGCSRTSRRVSAFHERRLCLVMLCGLPRATLIHHVCNQQSEVVE